LQIYSVALIMLLISIHWVIELYSVAVCTRFEGDC